MKLKPEFAGPPPAFREHLHQAFQRLRASLTGALAAIGADPRRARELSRLLEVNKNLAWRVSRIVTAHDAADAVRHVPGPSAFASLLAALSKAGVSDPELQAVRDALKAYDAMIATHSGDRATLGQLSAGLAREAGAVERLEQSRRQAFVGLGSTWGVQARAQFTTFIAAPSTENADVGDVVNLKGLLGLRRLRADARWTLFRGSRSKDDGSELPQSRPEPLDPAVAAGSLPLIRRFSSQDMPALEQFHTSTHSRWVLPSGAVGNTAAIDCVFGDLWRAALPLLRSQHNLIERLGTAIITPVELVQLDILLSERIPWARDPEGLLFSQLDGGSVPLADENSNLRLPLLETVQELGRGLPAMASLHVPRYTEMLELAFERAGWDAEGFLGYRLTMRYPAIPTILALGFRLPEAD